MKRLLVVLSVLVGCSGAKQEAPATASARASAPRGPACETAFGAPATFALDAADLRARGASPALLAKLAKDPYTYFRALGQPYALRTCAAFRDVRWHLPVGAVHGDAHVEQFVVTPETAGVEDFDQSGWGPAVVDLVRYAASLHLACRQVSWTCREDAVTSAFYQAYRASLDRPPARTTPAVVARLRARTPTEPGPWLAWADGLMRPVPAGVEARARRGFLDFQRQELEVHPAQAAGYYEIVRMGALQMGVGSALETKLLFHVRGPTEAPEDDVIIEARSTLPPMGSECPARPLHGGALEPLMFMALLGPRMPESFGYATLGDDAAPEFWVQSWVPGYRELSISDLESETELVELAEDAARQLAGSFWTRFPEPLRAVQRHAQLTAFDRVIGRVRTLSRSFADETAREWERFRAASRE